MAKKRSQWIRLTGASQTERLLKALLPESIPIDEQKISDLLFFASAYAAHIPYFNDLDEPAGTWAAFFQRDPSVFLAEVIQTDLETIDREFEEKIHEARMAWDQDSRHETLLELVKTVSGLAKILDDWYTRAQSLRDFGEETRIEQEIERAIHTELSRQLHTLSAIASAGPSDRPKQRFELPGDFHKIWQLNQKTVFKGLEIPDPSNFSAVLGKVQQIFRKFYLFALFIRELAPGLLELSFRQKSDHQPHIGLLIAFLHIYRNAQESLNTLTRRHLEHYYGEILEQHKKPGTPDKTFVCFSLADFARSHFLPKGTLLLAGINQDGLESHYRTMQSLEVNQAEISALKTLFVSKNPLINIGSSYKLVSNIFSAPVADSMDGRGMPFDEPGKNWPILGEEQIDKAESDRRMQAAEIGFVLASSVLWLPEGDRTVKLNLKFHPGTFQQFESLIEDISLNQGSDKDSVFYRLFHHSLHLQLTGETGWMPVRRYAVNPVWEVQTLQIIFSLPMADPPVARYNPEVITDRFDTPWPLLKILVSENDAAYVYSFLKVLRLETIDLEAEVQGLKSLQLYNELGLLDSSAPFQPFGPAPGKNAYLLIGSAELFVKELTGLKINIHWNNLPEEENGFEDYYAVYDQGIGNDSFQVKLSALSDFEFYPKSAERQEAFNLFATLPGTKTLAPHVQWEADALEKLQIRPDYRMQELPEYNNHTQTGYLKFQISRPSMVFGQNLYPRLFARIVTENARPQPFSLIPGGNDPKPLPNEPYVPVIRQLSLDYTARARMNMRVQEFRENNPDAQDQLIHILPFGKRTVFANGKATDHYLVPQFDADGYLLIGLKGLRPPQELSLLFHLEESVKKIDRISADLEWNYLRDGQWTLFPTDRILLDSTSGLTTTGVVRLDIPSDITPSEEILPQGLHWLRVAGTGNLEALGRGKAIYAQAVEAIWVDNGDSTHFNPDQPLPRIKDLVVPVPEIAAVFQPVGFLKSHPPEDERGFYIRTSERLRHKNRAIQLWDYERLILEHFPGIQQVKCLGSFGHEKFLEPGEVKVIVIPNHNHQPAPKAGFHDLQAIKSFLEKQGNPFARIQVINPVYEQLKVTCSLIFKKEFEREKGANLKQLHQDIREYICPWIKGRNFELGQEISKNDVFNFIRERPYVQFVSGFSLVQVYEASEDFYVLEDSARGDNNAEILKPGTPWSVFIPVDEHLITFVNREEYEAPEQAAIDLMRIGSDFVVLPDPEERVALRSAPRQPDPPAPEENDPHFLFE